MNAPKERILIVESDPTISDLIARQTLAPLGYQVQIVGASTSALQEAIRFNPDLIIANLNLPGLSGKDLLVAFTAQGMEAPIIVLAEKGTEGDIIQAFRLGAADFLTSPLREAEVVAAVERLLQQVRARREKELLSRQLNQTNQELQRRVRELTTIFAIGKAVVSVTDLRALLDKIIEGAVYVTEAESGWLLTRDERTKAFLLSAQRNLPRSLAANLNQPWDDGLSSLVALSGETLAIHGDPLKRFKIASLGQSALVVPIKVKKDVVGLIVVVRKTPQPFGANSQALLEAVADYASIAFVNARLFRALEERVKVSQQAVHLARFGERIGNERLQSAGQELSAAIAVARASLDRLRQDWRGKLDRPQSDALAALAENLAAAADISALLAAPLAAAAPEDSASQPADLNALARQSVERFRALAQKNQMLIHTELSSSPVRVGAEAYHVANILDSLLHNAIRQASKQSQLTVRVDVLPEKIAHLAVQDPGSKLSEEAWEAFFKQGITAQAPAQGDHFSGVGISLQLAREIAASYEGRIWVETPPGAGSIVHVTLPLARD